MPAEHVSGHDRDAHDSHRRKAGLPHADGIAGTFKALLASTTVTAAANAGIADTNTYYRIDGAKIGTGLELKAHTLQSGFWQYPDQTFPLPGGSPDLGWVWSGAPNVTTLGTVTSSCNNWTDSAGTIRLGRPHTAGGNFFDSAGESANCGVTWGLYCVQQ